MTYQPPSGNYPPPPPGNYPPPPPGGVGGAPPDNNLVLAILSLLLCTPLGIVAIIKSTQVSSLWAQGRAAEAQSSANDAKKFAIWGMIGGGVAIGISIILWVIFFVLMASTVNEISNIPSIETSWSSPY